MRDGQRDEEEKEYLRKFPTALERIIPVSYEKVLKEKQITAGRGRTTSLAIDRLTNCALSFVVF